MKIFKYVAIGLVALLVLAIGLDAAGYGPGYFSTVTIRKTLAVTGIATFTASPVMNGGITAGNTKIAGVDSFLTTAVVDTIAIAGVTTADIFIVTNKTFDYSTGADSVRYSYICKTDTVIIARNSSSGTFKSGGQYAFIRIDK